MSRQPERLDTPLVRARRHRSITAGLAIAALVVLAGCGGSTTPSTSHTHSGSTRGATLTVGDSIASIGSLDPAKANAGTDPVFLNPIYAPLIRVAPSGSLQGVLAESWHYVGTTNKTFQLTLRPGVKFSDGTAVTAAAVVASIKHYESGSDGTQWLAGCNTVTAVSTSVVQINCSSPNPDIAMVLSDQQLGGDIVAPASLAHPSTLQTDPIGAGEYTLDTAQTVSGSSYTYVANPRYFDQGAIHWNRIVVKYFANSNTGLAALRSGEIQYFDVADPTALTAAKSAGLTLSSQGGVFEGVGLFDRTSQAGNPVGNILVRQALEYAVDRPAIVKAIFGAFGSPTEEVAVPGQSTAWNPAVNTYYPYDPAKAKQLLAKAGYPNGFSINIEDQPIDATLTQAVAGYWNKIGVKTNITADATTPAWIHNALSKKFSVLGYAYGGLPMFLEADNWFRPNANPFNPFATNDATIMGLLNAAAAAPASEQVADFQKVQAAGVQQAWYVGVAVFDVGIAVSSSVTTPPERDFYLGNELDTTPVSG
jgi:peptide/nickel transport system substrate-binding protein